MTKIILSGRIPMPQGAYDSSKAYTINNLVAMYGMSFLANGDVAAGYAPAQLNQDGTVSLINTDKWTLFAGDPSAYNMKQYFDDTVEQITALIANKANIDGWYSTLTAGAAENLVGRGTTPAVISFRPAGGTQDIGTGAASIAKIKGRTDAWNMLARFSVSVALSSTIAGVDITHAVGSYVIRFNGQVSGVNSFNFAIGDVAPAIVSGHKYYISGTGVNGFRVRTSQSTGVQSAADGSGAICTASANSTAGQMAGDFTAAAVGHSFANYDINIKIVDLSQLYGPGREPATVAAFLAEYPEALTAPYNAGKLIPNKVTALVTDGFNQWDEVTELGGLDPNGSDVALTDRLRSKNYMPVFPNTAYYFKTPNNLGVFWYDINKAFISNIQANNTTITAPANAYYLRFYAVPAYGTTYKNDIAINLHHSGIRDGEYEPYWTSTLNIDHSKIYGRLNGEGEMVQIAPNGFGGAGTANDEIDLVKKEAYIRMAMVDLGTLGWTEDTSAGFKRFMASIQASSEWNNCICSKYPLPSSNLGAGQEDRTIKINNIYGAVARDDSYATVAAFKTAMSGVMLDFQLATPLHYTDLMYSEDGGQTFIEIPAGYRVDDFGTERRLPEGIVDGAPASTPLVAEIAYAMNAVDPLRNLPRNYLSKQSTENLLAAMQSAGIIAGYTMTYDEDNAEYDFTITAPAGA